MNRHALHFACALMIIAILAMTGMGCHTASAEKTDPETERLKASLIKAAAPQIAEAQAICARHKDSIRQIPGIPGYVRTGKMTVLPPEAQVTKTKSADIPYTGTVLITVEDARPAQPHYDTKEDAQNADLSVTEHRTTKHDFEYKGNKWLAKKPNLPQMAH